MGVLIGMAVFSSEENKKDECLEKTLSSLFHTVDFTKHQLMLSVNARTKRTDEIIEKFKDIIDLVYYNPENIGTAEAINKIWKNRMPGKHCVKMDDDVVIHQAGWLDLLVEAIEREPSIGICALKRKDCWERPWETSYEKKSELIYLPQSGAQKCIIVEQANHVMGTVQCYNSALLDKIKYLYQPNFYGYDDVLACHRSTVAGFKNVFIPYIEIDHIDKGDTPYQGWKERHSAEVTQQVIETVKGYYNGTISIEYNPFQ